MDNRKRKLFKLVRSVAQSPLSTFQIHFIFIQNKVLYFILTWEFNSQVEELIDKGEKKKLAFTEWGFYSHRHSESCHKKCHLVTDKFQMSVTNVFHTVYNMLY